jgi:hypothetical protein
MSTKSYTFGNVARRKKYIGECIYCGSTENLTLEHAMPESLNGDMELEDASCTLCATITGKFEGRFTGETLKPARVVLGMKSKRTKKSQPTAFPVRFEKDSEIKTLNIPASEFPAIIPLWELGPTGKYPGTPHALGLKHGEADPVAFRIRSAEESVALVQKHDADSLTVEFRLYLKDFLRMLAKIAYCHSVYRFGVREIEEVYVLPAILGKSDDILYWVGGDGKQDLRQAGAGINSFHFVGVDVAQGEIRARIKLFKDLPTPEYFVIVGRLSDRMRGVYESLGL